MEISKILVILDQDKKQSYQLSVQVPFELWEFFVSGIIQNAS